MDEHAIKRRRAVLVAGLSGLATVGVPELAPYLAPFAVGAAVAACTHHVKVLRARSQAPLAIADASPAALDASLDSSGGAVIPAPPRDSEAAEPPGRAGTPQEAHEPTREQIAPAAAHGRRRYRSKGPEVPEEVAEVAEAAAVAPVTDAVTCAPKDRRSRWARGSLTPIDLEADHGSVEVADVVSVDSFEEEQVWKKVQFMPGRLGLVLILSTGRVSVIKDSGQAMNAGVQVGWMCTELDGVPYTERVLQQKIGGTRPYVAKFVAEPKAASLSHSPVPRAKRITIIGASTGEPLRGRKRERAVTPRNSPAASAAKRAAQRAAQEEPCAIKRCAPPHAIAEGPTRLPGPACQACWRSLSADEKATVRRGESLSLSSHQRAAPGGA